MRNNINMCSNIKFAYAGGRSEIDYTRDRAFNKFCLSGEVSLMKCLFDGYVAERLAHIVVWSQCLKIMIVSRPIQTTGVLRRRIGSTYKCVSVFFPSMHVQKVWYNVYSVNIYHSFIC